MNLNVPTVIMSNTGTRIGTVCVGCRRKVYEYVVRIRVDVPAVSVPVHVHVFLYDFNTGTFKIFDHIESDSCRKPTYVLSIHC